jgi:hypothetical protein
MLNSFVMHAVGNLARNPELLTRENIPYVRFCLCVCTPVTTSPEAALTEAPTIGVRDPWTPPWSCVAEITEALAGVQPGTCERERRWKWGFLRTEAAPAVLARASACSEGARGYVGRVRARGAGGQRRVVSLAGAVQAQGTVDRGEPRCCGSELRGCAGLRYPAERRHWGDGLGGSRAAAAVSELGGAQQPHM